MMANNININAYWSQDLLPILSHALPSVISYTLPSSDGRVVQANAEGARILARHHRSSGTLSEKFTDNNDDDDIEETELFLKTVAAPSYAHKTWTDMRRTLVYLRTEVRFYNEIVPRLLLEASSTSTNADGASETSEPVRSSKLHAHLPTVHHAHYDLDGLVPENCPTSDAEQPSPFPEDDDEAARAEKRRLLEHKGGHILLQSLSPSRGYFQDSPLSLRQSSWCLKAVAELHASAWADRTLLETIGDRLSEAGGSYQLQFRNPKELRNMVASWDSFRGQFVGLSRSAADDDDDGRNVLEREGVVALGRRVYDMAEYVSRELTPSAESEYATLVHGDYKAMVST